MDDDGSGGGRNAGDAGAGGANADDTNAGQHQQEPNMVDLIKRVIADMGVQYVSQFFQQIRDGGFQFDTLQISIVVFILCIITVVLMLLTSVAAAIKPILIGAFLGGLVWLWWKIRLWPFER